MFPAPHSGLINESSVYFPALATGPNRDLLNLSRTVYLVHEQVPNECAIAVHGDPTSWTWPGPASRSPR